MSDHERSTRFHRGEVEFRLDGMRRLWAACGRPLAGRGVIHVAGSKGKGSVCAVLDALSAAHGLRRGVYLSPHVDHWGERVVRDGEEASARELGAALDELLALPEGSRASFFELLTAAAFVLLERHEPDVAVIETGLGGRLDATNVLPASTAVITAIELEHRAILGDGLSEIAREKCGIIKPEGVVVSGLRTGEVSDVVAEVARSRRSELWALGERWDWSPRPPGSLCWSGEGEEVVLPCPKLGPFSAQNAALAWTAFRLTKPAGVRAQASKASELLERLRMRGRYETIGEAPRVVRDGAHTPDGIREVCRSLRDETGTRPVLVLGLAEDKRFEQVVEAVHSLIGPLVATTVPGGRSRDPSEIAAAARRRGLAAEVVVEPTRALHRARELAGTTGSILVSGSFWLIGAFGGPDGGEA